MVKPTLKALYNISEKIRYEKLGSKILKGVNKNLVNNYSLDAYLYGCFDTNVRIW